MSYSLMRGISSNWKGNLATDEHGLARTKSGIIRIPQSTRMTPATSRVTQSTIRVYPCSSVANCCSLDQSFTQKKAAKWARILPEFFAWGNIKLAEAGRVG
jgi:hypothetical protein